MATSYALAAYTLQVHKKHYPKSLLPLDNFDGAGADLLKLLYGYHASVKSAPVHNSADKRLFEVQNLTPSGRRLNVRTEVGEYGYESRLHNVQTRVDTARRTTMDAEMLTLRNSFFVPKGKDTALMLTERVSRSGQVSIFSDTFKRAFKARYDDYMLVIEAVAPAEAIAAAFADGNVKTITLSKHEIPPDVADRFGMSNGVDLGTMETVIRAKKGGTFSRKTTETIRDAVKDAAARRNLLTVGAEEYNEIRVQVQVGRTSRRVDVSKGEAPRASFPFEASGRPKDQDVWDEAGSIAEDLSQYFGLSNALDQPFTWTTDVKKTRLPVPTTP